jgi:asparagine synthase (glutamine-hydrolysing)
MCGINGFISLEHPKASNAATGATAKLKQMNDLLCHRGPDAEGAYVKGPVGFGFRRLSIIDLTTNANQPMVSDAEDVVLIFNGEIYNYIEIKEQLLQKGHVFKTGSDTEVILRSYLEWGDSCVDKFNGMWAFAIYDFRKNRLFCSRDRLGVKPFYYCIKDGLLFFSSELKAIHLACDLHKANVNKVYEYLAYGYRTNDGETFFEGCNELLPGTNLIYADQKISLNKYWKLTTTPSTTMTKPEAYARFMELFESAVKLRYRSDVPVALLLSGGLDSTAIAKVTDDLIERGELGANEVHAFIASFPNFKDDETALAREFVKTCKHIKLHEIVIDTKEIVDDFENIIYGFDHPLSAFTSMAHNNIMRECQKRGIKVVLNGQGSDEAFAGYDRYISGAHLLDELLTKKGRFLSEFKSLNRHNRYSAPFLLSQMMKSSLRQPFASYLRARYQEKSISCLNKDFVRRNYRNYKSGYNFSLRGGNFDGYLLNQINHQGLNTILHYEDVSSMMQSIEIRSPFMDYRLMEFAFSIPNEYKFREGVTKIIQRETIGTRLPDSITKNRQKIGFRTPFIDYITKDSPFKSYITDLLHSEAFTSKKIWDAAKIRKMFEDPARNPEFPYWRIINLEVWSKVYKISNL